MKSLIKTTLIALLTAFLLVGGSSMGYAQKKTAKQQKSLVTQSMAQKIAERLLYDNRSMFYRSMFNNSNDIRTIRESDAILSEIGNHLDYAENFIISFLNYFGAGNDGYIAAKSIFYFTPDEYAIAEKIFKDVQAKEKQKAIKLEQAVYDAYVKDGFPSNIRKESNYKPGKYKIDVESIADYINSMEFKESCINTSYEVVTDNNGKMMVSPYDNLISAAEFTMSAPKVVFENLDKTLYVPTKYRLRIEETKIKALSDRIVKIIWNKRTQQWDLENPYEFSDEERSYRCSITGDLIDTLNKLSELKDAKKKKHTISVTAFIDGNVKCYLDGREIGKEWLQPHYFVKVIK